MKLEHRFRLGLAPDAVWETFEDSRLMAQCLPGAELERLLDADRLEGKLTVKLGPIVAAFDGTVTIERDPATRSGTMHVEGRDKRTGTRVRGRIAYGLTEREADTEVRLVSEISLAGSLAQFARRGLIEKVANDLSASFAANLEKRLSGTQKSCQKI